MRKPTIRWVFAGINTLLGQRALCTPHGFHSLHAFLDRGLGKIGSLLELLQNSRPLVLLLEPLDRAINRFVLRDDNTNQTLSPPSQVLL